MLGCEGDEGDVERIKQSEAEIKPSLANVMVSTNLSNGRAGYRTEKNETSEKNKVEEGKRCG